MHKKFQKPEFYNAIVQIIRKIPNCKVQQLNSWKLYLETSFVISLNINPFFCSFSFDSSFFLSKDYRSLAKNVFIVDTNLRPLILIRSATRLANLLIVIVRWSALLSNKISYEATKTILKTILQQDNCIEYMFDNINLCS